MQQRVLTFLPKFDLYEFDRCIGTIKKEFTFFVPHFTVEGSDWAVEGQFMEWDYTIVSASRGTVATIGKELFHWTDTYVIDVCVPFSPAFAGVPQRYLRVLNAGDAYADCLLDMETGDVLAAPAVTGEGVRRPALLLACTASGQWLTTANPRDSYDPQYSLYALWDPADFLADGQPAAWVTMYATE